MYRAAIILPLLVSVILSSGCSTVHPGPPREDAAQTGALQCPPPGQTIALPTGHPPIVSPGAEWYCREKNEWLMWTKDETGSVVMVQPSTMGDISHLSAGELAKLPYFTLFLEALLQAEYQGTNVNFEGTELKDASFNETPFFQITMDGELKSEDLSARLKVAMYFPKLKTFKYQFVFMSLKGQYEKDHYTMEHMLAGATPVRKQKPRPSFGTLREYTTPNEYELTRKVICEIPGEEQQVLIYSSCLWHDGTVIRNAD